MRIVADSNFLVSSLDPADLFHQECFPIFEHVLARRMEIVSPTLVLVETVCVLRRRTGSEAEARNAYDHLRSLPAISWIEINRHLIERACLLGVATALRGGDAIILAAAEQLRIPLVTKDGEMLAKAPSSIQVLTPTSLSLPR